MPKIIDFSSPRLNRRCLKLFFSVVICATASVAIPDELDMAWQVGRYSFVIPAPTLGQADLLSAATPIDFSESVTTVGDAIRQVLKNSGYRLADIKKMPLDTRTMLSLPLPQIHRHFDALPLWQVLHTLVGAQFVLINDPVHRLIGFEPCRSADQKGN